MNPTFGPLRNGALIRAQRHGFQRSKHWLEGSVEGNEPVLSSHGRGQNVARCGGSEMVRATRIFLDETDCKSSLLLSPSSPNAGSLARIRREGVEKVAEAGGMTG